jgi:hypothetical protein
MIFFLIGLAKLELRYLLKQRLKYYLYRQMILFINLIFNYKNTIFVMKSGIYKTNVKFIHQQLPDNYHIIFKKCRNEFTGYYNN